jgi:hypothetical protein
LELLEPVGKIVDDQDAIDASHMTVLFTELILRQSMPLMDVGIDVDISGEKYELQVINFIAVMYTIWTFFSFSSFTI